MTSSLADDAMVDPDERLMSAYEWHKEMNSGTRRSKMTSSLADDAMVDPDERLMSAYEWHKEMNSATRRGKMTSSLADDAMVDHDERLMSAHEWLKETDPATGIERYLNLATGEIALELPAVADGRLKSVQKWMIETAPATRGIETNINVDSCLAGLEYTVEEKLLALQLKEIAEKRIRAAKRRGSAYATLIEVVDPVSKRTGYYNTEKQTIQFRKPKGWVRMMSNKYSKRRMESIDILQSMGQEAMTMLAGGTVRERFNSNDSSDGDGSSGGGSSGGRHQKLVVQGSPGRRTGGPRRRLSLVAKRSRLRHQQEMSPE